MKNFLKFAVGVGVIALAMPAMAASVVASKHDLTSATGTGGSLTTSTDHVCVFCHTPHGGDSLAPLWNRDVDSSGFTMYSSATMNMTVAGAPAGVSLACLSCHDGAISYDTLYNGVTDTNSYYYTSTATDKLYAWSGAELMDTTVLPGLGKDLSNDHPISITYDTAQDAAFNSIAAVTGAGVPLYGTSGNQVECGSCHNPHDSAIVPFLRISNAASGLCTTCHIK